MVHSASLAARRMIHFYRSTGATVQMVDDVRDDLDRFANGARLSIELIADPSVFSTIHHEWNALVSSSSASVFQSFDWLFPWWRHFGAADSRQLHILFFRLGTQLVGIAPFFSQLWPAGRGRSVCQLRMLGCGVPRRGTSYELFAEYPPSDFLDVIAAKGFEEEVGVSVAAFLNRCSARFAEISLDNIPLDGILYTHVVPRLDRSLFHLREIGPERCPQLIVPLSVQECIAAMKSGTRRKIQQARNAFSEGTFAFIESIETGEAFDEAFNRLMDLHQRRWTSLGFPGVFSDSRFREFQEEVARRFMSNGWLWFKIARYNGEAIAARMSFRFNHRMYDYLSGFDHTMPGANRRPGLALLFSMLVDARRDDINVVELLRGVESYKLELTSDLRYICDLKIRSRELSAFPPVRIAFALQGVVKVIRSVHKEWRLLQVQYNVHGPLLFLITYVKFTMRRLRDTLSHIMDTARRSKTHTGNDRTATHERVASIKDAYPLIEQAVANK